MIAVRFLQVENQINRAEPQKAVKKSLLAAICATLLGSLPLAAAEKTDVVILENGDHITGEIKKLDRGKLELHTDALGTIYINWLDIERITSRRHLEVEVDSGEKFFGTLGPASEEGKLEVTDENTSAAVESSSVVRMTPIEAGFWRRLNGSLDLGLDLARANRARSLDFGTKIELRARKYLRSLTMNTTSIAQEETETKVRFSLGFGFKRFLKARRMSLGFAQLQQNEELDLDYRTLVGAGYGRYLIQNNKTILTLFAGLAVSQERHSGLPAEEGAEAVAGLEYSMFIFNEPETDIDLTLLMFPSLTTSGRVRAEFKARIRREIGTDFFLMLTVLDSFDSDPHERSGTHDPGTERLELEHVAGVDLLEIDDSKRLRGTIGCSRSDSSSCW